VRGFSVFRMAYSMLDFDVNEGFIERRADCVGAPARADAPTPGRHARSTRRYDRPLRSPS
jgi:hypothetical protein